MQNIFFEQSVVKHHRKSISGDIIIKKYIINLVQLWKNTGRKVIEENRVRLTDDAVIINSKQEQILDNLFELQKLLKKDSPVLADFLLKHAILFIGDRLATALFGDGIENALFNSKGKPPYSKMWLSKKEESVLILSSQGFQYSEIGLKLGHSQRYIERLTYRLFSNYGYSDITHLTCDCIRKKLIPPTPVNEIKIRLSTQDQMFFRQRSFGISNDAICKEMVVNKRTMECRIAKVLKKTGHKRITGLCCALLSAGLLD